MKTKAILIYSAFIFWLSFNLFFSREELAEEDSIKRSHYQTILSDYSIKVQEISQKNEKLDQSLEILYKQQRVLESELTGLKKFDESPYLRLKFLTIRNENQIRRIHNLRYKVEKLFKLQRKLEIVFDSTKIISSDLHKNQLTIFKYYSLTNKLRKYFDEYGLESVILNKTIEVIPFLNPSSTICSYVNKNNQTVVLDTIGNHKFNDIEKIFIEFSMNPLKVVAKDLTLLVNNEPIITNNLDFPFIVTDTLSIDHFNKKGINEISINYNKKNVKIVSFYLK